MTDLSAIVARTLGLFRKRVTVQCAALCYRIGDDGAPVVLLITSRDTGRWVIPKGNIDAGEKGCKAAEREALEEAGAKGKAAKKALGFYSYVKDGRRQHRVEVFPLRVRTMIDEFPEQGQREQVWLSPEEAALRVAEPELKNVIRLFGLSFQKALYRRGNSAD